MNEKNNQRATAHKLLVCDILSATYQKPENEDANFLLIENKKINRINLIGIIVQKESLGNITNLLLDDGSGRIIVRSFEETVFLKELCVGSTILVIGKVREYNNEKYLSYEVIKEVSSLWLKVRSIELMKNQSFVKKEATIIRTRLCI